MQNYLSNHLEGTSDGEVVQDAKIIKCLEPEIFEGFREICEREGLSTEQLCTIIQYTNQNAQSFTMACCLFLLQYFRDAATEAGHDMAGHNNIKDAPNRKRQAKR